MNAFNIRWLMEILRIYLKEQQLIKYYAINIAKNPNYDEYQCRLAWAVTQTEELHKPIIRKVEKLKVHSSFKVML